MAIILPKLSRHRSSAGLAAETQPAVNVTLCREDGVYAAGTELTARWRLRRVAIDDIQSVEVSVLWHTQGKGDEDLHVHHFQQVTEKEFRRRGLADEQSLRCTLPVSPLSYHGHLIHLRWCIRLRLFLTDGREILAEQPFHLIGAHLIGASEPKPSEPKPSEPKPSEPKPSEPKPSEAKPSEAKPSEPKQRAEGQHEQSPGDPSRLLPTDTAAV